MASVVIISTNWIVAKSKLGLNCNIGQNVVISPNVILGNNVKVQNNVSIYTGVILEDDVFCDPSMVFTNVTTPRSEIVRRDQYQQTLVRRGASMGANSTIVCPVEIGRFAFVGAGAVVARDVPDYALAVGVPAKFVGWMCRCGVKLPQNATGQFTCPACSNVYQQLSNESLSPVKEVQGNG